MRFIPTYMGNAAVGRLSGCMDTVHPHVHGERETPIQQIVTDTRFIPTYMGNA